MKTLFSVIAVESKKLTRSYVIWGTLALCLFVCAIRAGGADWNTYLGNVVYMFATVLGLVGFAVLTSWSFGREYTDRTFKDLLALPVSRGTVVAAKTAACLAWCLILAGITFVFSLLVGFIVGIPGFSETLALHYCIQFMITVAINLLLCGPVVFLASISRGYLVPIAYAFTTMMVAFIAGPTELGSYLPWAIPALQLAGSSDAVFPLTSVSYLIPVMTGVVGLAATWAWWRWADHK
ncbi:ABC transporter permease [Paenibacillus kribbensis]|uniref:ABC transporter permease n=1 Tax=Paenibacillus kribbensis TaxID=172713 RepID=UPI000839176F|nr:ABC transporter permease [Paenibacillus kribbensis]